MQDTPDENVERPEIYDAKSNSWSFATPEIRAGARKYHTATVLGDGRILYAGGSRDLRPIPYVTVYDPSSNTWTQVGSMIEPRCGHSAELLPSGDVLAVGGGCGSEPPSGTMEQYSRADNRWYPVASMAVPRANVVTVNLDNGVIFAFGGEQHGVTNTVVEAERDRARAAGGGHPGANATPRRRAGGIARRARRSPHRAPAPAPPR